MLALGGSSRLAAQYDRRYEVGLFGAYTKYGPTFGLANKAGGGARFSYALNPKLGLEVEAIFQSPQDITSATQIEPMIGSGSLIVNVLNQKRATFFILGGYSRLDFGGTDPYRFTDGGWHGGAGAKLYVSSRLALRLDARAIYSPNSTSGFTDKATHYVGSAGLSFFQAGSGIPSTDTDRDGVADKKDTCPDTPLGATVDGKGCPSDQDGDAVLNGIDHCPDTPSGATVDARGCPGDQAGGKVFDGIEQCPDTQAGTPVDSFGCPADSDKDGVGDGFDKCPNTPAGIQVDATGCPMAHDTDGDGVVDPQDRCPNTPAGQRVDQYGCMLLFEEHTVVPPGRPPARPTLILQDVNFQTGSWVLIRVPY